MNIAIKIKNFDVKNLIISEKCKNNVMTNSFFYRFYYSDDSFISNGLSISFNIKNINIEKYYTKIKCHFKKNDHNTEIIKLLSNIENDILKQFNINSKPTHRLKEQLSQYFIKLFNDEYHKFKNLDNLEILLKISGMWLTNNEYGLTFRFYFVK